MDHGAQVLFSHVKIRFENLSLYFFCAVALFKHTVWYLFCAVALFHNPVDTFLSQGNPVLVVLVLLLFVTLIVFCSCVCTFGTSFFELDFLF